MSLAMEGRTDAADKLLSSLREYAKQPDNFVASTMLEVTVPLCEAVFAYGRGDYAVVVRKLLPLRPLLAPIGGSHAQRDVFVQMLLESAIRCGKLGVARTLLSERICLRPTSFGDWTRYADVLEKLNDAGSAALARARAAELRAAA